MSRDPRNTQHRDSSDGQFESSSKNRSVPAQLILSSQKVEARQSASDIASWDPEPENRLVQVQGPPERERGWTNYDWFLAFDHYGRTYQAYNPGEYDLPNDGEEQDRQDFQHALFEILLDGKLGLAPIESPLLALDIGTGTGIWAIDFAEQYPACQVIGTDLSIIQATPRTSNCQFFLENSETQDWLFASTLDYVHLRNMGPCFTDIRTVLRKAFNHMSPGGWIELQDGCWELFSIDGSHHGSAFERWLHLVQIGAANQGRDMSKVRSYREYLGQVGFTNIQDKEFPMPTSPWVKDRSLKRLGYYLGTTMLCALAPYRRTLAFAGLDEAEIEDLVNEVTKELHDIRRHWYMLCYVVWAQKPMTPPVS